MSYSAKIELEVRQEIGSWKLSRALVIEVLNRLLIDLPAAPDSHLVERIVPLAYFAYHFTLVDDGPVPFRLHFMFAVDRLDKVQELIVVGCRLTREEKGEN